MYTLVNIIKSSIIKNQNNNKVAATCDLTSGRLVAPHHWQKSTAADRYRIISPAYPRTNHDHIRLHGSPRHSTM